MLMLMLMLMKFIQHIRLTLLRHIRIRPLDLDDSTIRIFADLNALSHIDIHVKSVYVIHIYLNVNLVIRRTKYISLQSLHTQTQLYKFAVSTSSS